MTSYVPVPRPLPRAGELTLLTAAQTTDQPARWENGLAFPSVSCGDLLEYDPCGGNAVSLLARGTQDVPDYAPPVLQSWFRCSTGTSAAYLDEVRAQAVAQLDALTPYGVERELFYGTLARNRGLPNRALTATDADVTAGQVRAVDVTPTAGTSVSPLAAVGYLEGALASYPGRSYLHAGPVAASFLAREATRTGNVLQTKLGSILVPGGGYGLEGPNGAAAPAGTAWVYGTGPVTVRLGPSEVPADGALTIDRATNSQFVRAERYFAATWDGCALFAVLMTLKSD